MMHRWKSRVHVALLTAGCHLRGGHDYGRHFEALIGPMLARGDLGERPWCSRCGKDQP